MVTRLKRRSLFRITGATLAGVGFLNAGRVAASGSAHERARFWAVYRGLAGRALSLDTPG